MLMSFLVLWHSSMLGIYESGKASQDRLGCANANSNGLDRDERRKTGDAFLTDMMWIWGLRRR
jgi:hypothetical protein